MTIMTTAERALAQEIRDLVTAHMATGEVSQAGALAALDYEFQVLEAINAQAVAEAAADEAGSRLIVEEDDSEAWKRGGDAQ